jgi:hypothetical protein
MDTQRFHHAKEELWKLKDFTMQKKNYGNSKISPCKNIIFKKSSKRNTKSFKILL